MTFSFSVLGEKYGEVSKKVVYAVIKYLFVFRIKAFESFCRREYLRKTYLKAMCFVYLFLGKVMNEIM